MNWDERASKAIEQLLLYAERKNLIESIDIPYCRNLLLAVLEMELPADVTAEDAMHDTATVLVNEFCDLACEKGLIGEMSYERELYAAKVMGCVTPSPAMVRRSFLDAVAAGDTQKATDDFYQMCRASDYIKVDAIAQNVRFFEETKAGELEITINLSKPEKDPKEIAKLKNAPSIGYPKCMLCVENPGYAGRSNFPARQNHRIVPIKLNGADWFIQYSPYAYYPEHCIVFNSQHVPMKIDRGTFERLFDFVGQFPHYMLGSNADLPIVGGSILNHDHFQGGSYSFPMDKAPVLCEMTAPVEGVKASILDWPMSCLALEGKDPTKIIELADKVLNAWKGYSDPACDIYAETEGNPHNTITPIARKIGENYRLTLVLRNNRTSDEHPLGIFHPHAPLHHIKKENIGLIEVMGLFILPGRLKTELELLCDYLTGEKTMVRPAADDPCEKHFDWLEDVVARNGINADRASCMKILRKEVADVCAQVLADAGVYKQDAAGLAGMKRFLEYVGFNQ